MELHYMQRILIICYLTMTCSSMSCHGILNVTNHVQRIHRKKQLKNYPRQITIRLNRVYSLQHSNNKLYDLLATYSKYFM